MGKTLTDAEKAERATAELREATREAHEALADMRREMKALRALKVEVEEAASNLFAEKMTDAMSVTLDTWNTKTQEFIQTAEVAIDRRFDTLSSILLGEGRREGPSIAEMAQAVRDKMERDRGEPR